MASGMGLGPVSPRDARFDALAAMATDLDGRFALATLLERVLRHTMELLGCDGGSICTVDEVAGTYRNEVDLGIGCLSGRTFPLDEGVTAEVVRARRSVVFDEFADVRGGHITSEDRSSLHGVIGVPIRWNGSIIGTCVVFSRDPARRFTDDDVTFVELFATHAAIAIALAVEKERDAAIMAERERVVRDVHDTVGRGLATVLLHLDAAEREFRVGLDPAPALADARSAARAALTETQRTVLGLGPELLDGQTSRARWRVLVVHGRPVMRAGLVRMLSQVEPDIQVIGEIGDARQAVEAFELLRPHVVLADLDLPHVDGVQLTAYLRAADPAAAVVLLIGSVADDRVRAAAQIGAVGFVERDADPAALARSIVAAARGDSLVTAEFLSRFSAALVASPDGDHLTAREREVRGLVERGLPDKQIASELRISVKTVEKHVGAILRKTGATNRTMLAGQSAHH